MRHEKWLALILLALVVLPFSVSAQDDVQVVPIGDSIKPESPAPSTSTRRRRRYVPPSVKEGTTFMVSLGTALSSGLTREGETVTLYAAEDVGPSRSPGILIGALGRGTVTSVDKKGRTLTVRMETISANDGSPLAISGNIDLNSDSKDAASAAVGEKFTASLNEKLVVKRQRNKKEDEPEVLTGFVELSGKGAKADLKKGKAKGKIEIIVEAPKGYTADDIETGSVVLSGVNGRDLAQPVVPNARDPKQGDANKNGTTDWKMYFDSWEFIKNQPEGVHNIAVSGKLRDGKPFEAVTRVQIDY